MYNYDWVNVWEETIGCLKRHGKTEEDVLWVGRGFDRYDYSNRPEKHKSAWEDFRSKADFCYDSGYGYGTNYIPLDLIYCRKGFLA